tara:strand:- start:40 stop:636 length:597 start_codon:yes stop_codon:yes gene_type:complete
MFKKNIKIFFILILININSYSIKALEPNIFVQSTVNRASQILGDNISKDQKIEKLKLVAIDTVDIKGIGLYTLGKHRKVISDDEKKKYNELFEKYFLKTFSSRLAEYSNPKIEVKNQEVINKNYTIVSSILIATDERPEVKIDWRIYTKNTDKPLIRDLIIEGLSLARTQKEEFNSIIQSNNGDMNALFENLEKFINN